MRTKLTVLDELQTWGEMYQEKLNAEAELRKTVRQCTNIRKKSVEAFKGWVTGTVPIPQKHEREEEITNINELASHVNDLRDRLVDLYHQLAGWDAMLSNLPNKHRRLLELLYKEQRSLEQACVEMDISKRQALKIQQQSLNLLRAIG